MADMTGIIPDIWGFWVVYNSGSTSNPVWIAKDCGCYSSLSLGEVTADTIEVPCRNTNTTITTSGTVTYGDCVIEFVLDIKGIDGYNTLIDAQTHMGSNVDVTFVLLDNFSGSTDPITVSTTGVVTIPTTRNAVMFTGKISLVRSLSIGANDSGAPTTGSITINQSSPADKIIYATTF